MTGRALRPFEELMDLGELAREQLVVAALDPPRWRPGPEPLLVGGAFVAFARGEQGPGRPGDRAHVGAALTRDTDPVARTVVSGVAPASYAPGLLAAREGALLASALRALPRRPDVLLVAVHAAWRTDDAAAAEVVMRCTGRARTPEPLRLARMAAREARSAASGYRQGPTAEGGDRT